MPKRIHKYQLTLEESQEVVLPKGAKVLCFANQFEVPTIWAEVDPSEQTVSRAFRIIGAGHELLPVQGLSYIGTATFRGGTYVWHLYELLDWLGPIAQ